MAKNSGKNASQSLTERLDREQASRAYKKIMAGEEPTLKERAALRRVEKAKEESSRWEHYESIPQKHWRQMSGRQTKVLREQAERYGIPFGGRTISLPKVVHALHEFLATHGRKLTAEDDPLMTADGSSPALEQYRTERAALAKLDRQEREGELIRRSDVHQGLGRVAQILRAAGESLQAQFGREAADVLIDALNDAERDIAALFGESGG